MLFSLARCSSSTNALAASAGRFSAPSGSRMSSPNASTSCGQTFGARFDDLAGYHVTVDDDAAALAEGGGHRRLAGADTAGQTDAQHAGRVGQTTPMQHY